MARGTMFGGEAPLAGVSAPVVQDFDATTGADGGLKPADADKDAAGTLKLAASIVVGSLVALWAFGGIVFKDANL